MTDPSPHQLRPFDDVVIELDASEDQVNSAVKALCRRVLPGWADVEDSDMEISAITGGITNKLFKVTPSSSRPGIPPVAVKVFGSFTEILVDRDAEVKNLLLLNDYGFGAQILALFGNGRIEEFLVARTLEPHEMADPAYVPRIARLLRLMHGVGSSSSSSGGANSGGAASGTETSDQAAMAACVEGGDASTSALAASMDRSDRLWPTLWAWLDIAKKLTFKNDQDKAQRFAAIDLGTIEREMRELQSACEATRSPVVFAHNDLLSGNILIVQGGRKAGVFQPCASSQVAAAAAQPASTAATTVPSGAAAGAESASTSDPADGEMQFIDFEYSGFAARGFDLGNHFNEYAGFACDHSRYPNLDAQRAFLRHYVAAAASGDGPSAASDARVNDKHDSHSGPADVQPRAPAASSAEDGAGGPVSGTKRDGGPDASAEGVQKKARTEGGAAPEGRACASAAATDADVDQLLGETAVYSLASHVYWAVWALIQARYSPIEFDYMGFFDGRWGEYLKRKDERMALAARLCRS